MKPKELHDWILSNIQRVEDERKESTDNDEGYAYAYGGLRGILIVAAINSAAMDPSFGLGRYQLRTKVVDPDLASAYDTVMGLWPSTPPKLDDVLDPRD
jgi:hypothetical protein